MDWDVSTFSGVKREGDGPRLYCDACGGTDFASGDDGFYYCQMCGSQSQDVVDTGCAMEDILGDNHGSGALYSLYRSRARTQSQTPTPAVRKDDILRSLANSLASGRNPKKEAEKGPPYGFEEESSAPRDFPTGSCSDADALAIGIRTRYMQGLQVILQLQCEALVEKFGVSPIICGLAGTIWLRYVASSMVFDEGWAQKTIEVSEVAFAQSHHERPGVGLYHLYASSHAWMEGQLMHCIVIITFSLVKIGWISSKVLTYLIDSLYCHSTRWKYDCDLVFNLSMIFASAFLHITSQKTYSNSTPNHLML